MKSLHESQIAYSPHSIVDSAGRVFFHEGRVFRAVFGQAEADFYRRILSQPFIADAFEAGLVKTWVAEDVAVPAAKLVLEHERVSFETAPPEYTATMLWESARMLVRVATLLAEHGVYLKDAHPWNVMFRRGRPTLIDFGSLGPAEYPRLAWLDEFRRCFAVPIWLASRRMGGFAREYRREHGSGFGMRLWNGRLLKWPLLFAMGGMNARVGSADRFLRSVGAWLEAHPPVVRREYWADYPQGATAEDPLAPATDKQRFVYDALRALRPATVLDCAANKGYYSEMAARLGAAVVAFDYEEYCVDESMALAREKGLDITPALMDFKVPTAPVGWGLAYSGAFDRFRSDVVLALGLVHHLCLTQRVPVRLFCETCLKYSSRGIVLEYVDPSDLHVKQWNASVPDDYSVEGFSRYLSQRYPRRETMSIDGSGGLVRTMLLFKE